MIWRTRRQFGETTLLSDSYPTPLFCIARSAWASRFPHISIVPGKTGADREGR